MSTRKDILAAVRGQMPERVPWTVYSFELPRGEAERGLRAQGLGLVHPVPILSAQNFEYPNVEVCQRTTISGGETLRHVRYRTPIGEVTELRRSALSSGIAGFVADWRLEHMVKQPCDYDILEFMVRDQVCRPDYAAIVQAQEEIGEDGVVIGRVGKVPFQRLWTEYTGLERLCVDLHDDPRLVERVMEAMVEKDHDLWHLMAESPAELIQCADSITADVVGPRLFERYFLPYYQALAEVMGKADKPILLHVDGRVRNLSDSIKRLPQGIIVEALTPAPTGDYSIAEARANWKDRPIWINFPSSVHLWPVEEVEAVALEILRQAAPGNGFLFGITENMPANRWQKSMAAIGRVISQHGACPIQV
jgi:hypothetical protein